MLPRDLARLAVKIVAIVMLVYGVTALPVALRWLTAPDVPNPILTALTVSVVPATLWILVGIGLYFGAGRIVEKSSPAQQQPDLSGLDARAIESVAIAVLGLYILTNGVAEAVYYWGKVDLFYRYVGVYDRRLPVFDQTDYAGLLAAATRCVIGLVLLIFSRGVTALRRRLLDLRPMVPSEREDTSSVR